MAGVVKGRRGADFVQSTTIGKAFINKNISNKTERHPGVYYRGVGSEHIFVSYEEYAGGQGGLLKSALSWDTKGLGGALLNHSRFPRTLGLIKHHNVTQKL